MQKPFLENSKISEEVSFKKLFENKTCFINNIGNLDGVKTD